ncbi:MAG: hypothetical protein PUF77_02695 [Clostridiales bacterium]|nr:hypothetical protein [Clostridiales bacterium]
MSKGKYDDIIELPYKGTKRRPPMSMEDRAAQFAPFAPLKVRLSSEEDDEGPKD